MMLFDEGDNFVNLSWLEADWLFDGPPEYYRIRGYPAPPTFDGIRSDGNCIMMNSHDMAYHLPELGNTTGDGILDYLETEFGEYPSGHW